jgi:hypothetical protein
MENKKLLNGISKLAMIAERAGFSVEHLIQLLNYGLTEETLIDLISWRLERPNPATPPSSAHWVV